MRLSDCGPAFFVATAAKLEAEGGLGEQHGRRFAAAITTRAIYAERQDRDHSLVASTDHPGYLHRKVDGRDVHVPFNLAFALPDSPTLLDAIKMAEAVRLAYGHPIGLSGSATFLGRIDRTADLDFCEYYPTALSTLPPAIEEKASAGGTPYLVAVKCSSRQLDIPHSNLRAQLDDLLGSDGAAGVPRIKLDFVGLTDRFGPIPVTNVVLPISKLDFEHGRASSSFAYQEAIVSTATPIRTLLRPEEFARYLSWLRGECAHWLSEEQRGQTKAPLKSLKRILSIYMMLGYDLSAVETAAVAGQLGWPAASFSPVELVISSLNEGALARIVEDLKLSELRSFAPRDHIRIPASVLQEIHETEPLDREVVELALEAARELAEALTAYVDEMFANAQAGSE